MKLQIMSETDKKRGGGWFTQESDWPSFELAVEAVRTNGVIYKDSDGVRIWIPPWRIIEVRLAEDAS